MCAPGAPKRPATPSALQQARAQTGQVGGGCPRGAPTFFSGRDPHPRAPRIAMGPAWQLGLGRGCPLPGNTREPLCCLPGSGLK